MTTRCSKLTIRKETWLLCLALLTPQLGYTQTPSIVPFGTLGGSACTPYGLNPLGQVVGSSLLGGDFEEHAFLWSGGTMTDLGTLGGTFSVGYAINKSGQIAGFSDLPGDSGFFNAFLYSGGKMQALPTLGGNYATAIAINDAGQIIDNSSLDGDSA